MRSCERMVMADDATRVSCTMQYCSESNIDGHECKEDGDVKCLDVVLLPHVRKCRQNKSVCKRKRDIVVQQVVNKRICKVSRKKRSCLSRSARSSEWGLIWNVKEDAGMDRELDINKIMFERLGKATGRCQSGETYKDDENSGILNSISGGLTTDMRLKIKVGGENLYYPNVLDSKSVYGLTSASNLGPGSGSQNLATHIGDKLFEEEAIGKFESDENYLYKLADVLSGQTDDLESTSLMERSDGKSEETCLLTPSKKLTDALMEPVNIESMDPGTGTSPDSEVIDSIPEAQVGEKQWEDLKNSDFGSSKELKFSVHDTASKSRRKKGKLACSRDGSVRDVSPGLKSHNVSKTKAKASKTQRRKKTACKHGEKQGRSIIKGGVKGKSAPDKALCKTEDYLCEENDAVVKQKLDLGGKFNADEKEVPASLNMVPGSGLREQHSSPRKAWVCCDDCHKWRHIPASLADLIEETKCAWTCKDSDDKAYADCSIAQEKSNAEINVELGISDASDEEDNSEDSKYYKESEHQHPMSSQESTFTHISANKFLHRCRKTQTIDEIMVCYCTPPLEGQLGCGDACLNRILNIECVQGGCPCGDRCSNQQFQKRNYAKLEWFKCGKKGYGLKASEDISEGQFLIEYVGEVLDVHTYWARQREYGLKGHRHFYFMSLNGSEVIDASAKGNLGRFVNHSCDPNCRTEKWMVNGEICIGLFALRDIKQDEELTFDYNYVRDFGAAAKKCYCGSPHCQGYIGGDPRNAEIINQDDSDEEFPEPVMLAEGDTEEGPVDHPDKENSLNPASASSQLHQINVSVKKGKVCANHTNNLEVTVTTNRLKVPSIKHKKAVEGSSNGHFETVEEKLKELIDPDGGISRSKDATKGYLKLLLLTVASGDWSNGQVIQSNRDLSMILGALLETKSRAVMRDIIKHNGLRMLHNIMKQYRRDFKKIPILRKLLKVLERLAERKILTCDHINSGPPCRGMESFRESMLSLTEHKDKEVHGIARSFRDKWIPRSVRKHGFINRGDCGKSYRNFRHDRFSASLNYPCEQNLRPTKAVDCAHLPLVETSSVNSVVQEVCSAPSHNGCEIMGKMGRKRKSRWDEPAETNSVVSSEYNKGKVVSELLKQDKVFSVPYLNVCELRGQMRRKRKSRWDEAAETNSVVYGQSKQDGMIINAVNVGHNISEDVVPGVSCLFRPLDSSNASQNSCDLALQHPGHSGSRCHSGAVIGHPREKFNSRLPVSYGVPWPIIQQHGTTNLENDCSWATAPGIPFYPFPAPPSYPPQNDCQSYKSTDAMKIDRPAEIVKRESSGLVNCYSDDVNLSTTGLDAKDLSYEDNNHIAKPLEDSPNDLGRS